MSIWEFYITGGKDTFRDNFFIQRRSKMKIIDEKGRLFGRINIFDFLVILFLFCFIPLFYFGYDIYYIKTNEINSQLKGKWVEIKLKISGIIPEETKVLQEGDVEKNSAGKIIAKLKKIISDKPSELLTLALKEERLIPVAHPFLNDVVVLLDLFCTNDNSVLYLNQAPIKIGNQFTFSTNLYNITGTIIGINSK